MYKALHLGNLRHRKPSLSYLLCVFVFILYILIALDKLFLPIDASGPYADAMRQVPFMSHINLIPFYFGPFGSLDTALPTMLLNILLTIPFGFGINFIMQIRAKRFLWIAPLIGVGIEIIQLIISLILGYPYRFIDINDVLMNALGIWIGYSIFRIFALFYLWVTQRLNIEHEGLAAYIYTIASRADAHPS